MHSSLKLLIVALAFPPSLALADEPAPPAPPSLSGRWTLDPEKSEDGRQKMREAFEGMQGRGGGGHGGGGHGGGGGYGGGGGGGTGGGGHHGGGGHGGGGYGGRGGGQAGGGGFRESMHSLVDAPPGLTITQGAEEITIIEEDGRLRAVHPDRKEYKGTGGEKVQARWEGAQLVVETKGEQGPRLVESFEAVGDELVSLVKLEGGRSGQTVSVRRVYRKVPPEAAARPDAH